MEPSVYHRGCWSACRQKKVRDALSPSWSEHSAVFPCTQRCNFVPHVIGIPVSISVVINYVVLRLSGIRRGEYGQGDFCVLVCVWAFPPFLLHPQLPSSGSFVSLLSPSLTSCMKRTSPFPLWWLWWFDLVSVRFWLFLSTCSVRYWPFAK